MTGLPMYHYKPNPEGIYHLRLLLCYNPRRCASHPWFARVAEGSYPRYSHYCRTREALIEHVSGSQDERERP